MGSIEFDWKGKTYCILYEGGVPFPANDEEENACEEFRKSNEGIAFFGPIPTDWSVEHYLDDRYPFDAERGCRVDVEDQGRGNKSKVYDEDDDDEDGYDDEPYIDWCSYEKCRYGCYRHFYLTGEEHVCSQCGVYSCKECAEGTFKKCADKDCDEEVCGNHKYCEDHGSRKKSKT